MTTITRFITSQNRHKVALCSLSLLALFLLVWHLGTNGQGGSGAGLPGPAAVAHTAAELLRDPFYDNGPNDKGIGLQLAHSLSRLSLGYGLGSLVAIFLGVVLGLNPDRKSVV